MYVYTCMHTYKHLLPWMKYQKEIKGWVGFLCGNTIDDFSDVGFPSICCDYHWLIKKLSWSCVGNRGMWGELN